MKIVPIVTAKETFSPGDAMRDIYTRGLVTTDFVLVMGDLVSNVRIDDVVRIHKERRKTNKDAIMTMVVKPSGAKHRTRLATEIGARPLSLTPTTSSSPGRWGIPLSLHWTQIHRNAFITNPSSHIRLLVSRIYQENSWNHIRK